MSYMTAPPSRWKESAAARLYHIPGENTRIIYFPIRPDLPPLQGQAGLFVFLRLLLDLCSCAGQIRAAPRARLRDPLQAAHVGPGRSAAAALASSLPVLDPHQDAQQQGQRAQALRIRAAAAAPSSFVPTVDTGRSKTTLDAQEVNCRLDK